jgi:hypothetical protein
MGVKKWRKDDCTEHKRYKAEKFSNKLIAILFRIAGTVLSMLA